MTTGRREKVPIFMAKFQHKGRNWDHAVGLGQAKTKWTLSSWPPGR